MRRSLSKCRGRLGQIAITAVRTIVSLTSNRRRGGLSSASFALASRSIALSFCTLCLGCGGEAVTYRDTSYSSRPMASWIFATTDGTPFSAKDVIGRTTIVLFLTTYDVASQIAANRLEVCIHSLARRTNAIAVAMEPPDHAVLVGTFHDALRLSFPVLMPDPGTLAGQGPFGAIEMVPTWVVLTASGDEVWRGVGVGSLPQLREILVRMGNAAEQQPQGCS